MLATQHETKANVVSSPPTHIVAAYGARKCPKLVEQLGSPELQVRTNALAALCDEFRNPYSVFGCSESGVVPVLAGMVTDPDYTTRERASRALALAAADAVGAQAILFDEFEVANIIKGVFDTTLAVRRNIYQCLANLTRLPNGIKACVKAGATKHFIEAVVNEHSSAQPSMLETVANLARAEDGLEAVLSGGGIGVCISLLSSPDADVRVQAAATLGLVCFADGAKDQAIEQGALPALLNTLKSTYAETRTSEVNHRLRLSASSALMAVSTSDEGKRQMYPSGGIPVLAEALIASCAPIWINDEDDASYSNRKQSSNTSTTGPDKDRVVRLNLLKTLTNCAVLPASRIHLVGNDDLVARLRFLANSSNDALMKRHAEFALDAVKFQP